MAGEVLYTEKQFIGYNPYAILRRSVIAVFLFLAYYFAPETNRMADYYFFGGLALVVASVALLWVLHFETILQDGFLILDGLWTSRKVKVDLSSIETLEKTTINTSVFHRPAYNLHKQNEVRFFTYGNQGVVLTDRQGTRYIIGSQRTNELYYILKSELKALQKHA